MPLGTFGWALSGFAVIGAVILSYFHIKCSKGKDKGWSGALLDIINVLGMFLIGGAGVVIALRLGTQEQASRKQEQIARKREVTPRIFISSVEYDKKVEYVDKTNPPKHIFLNVKNMGRGDATDLCVALERYDPKENDIKKRTFAGPCLREVPGEIFSIDQLCYLPKGEGRKIPFEILQLYPREETDASQDSFYWQKQRFKAYVWYKNVEDDSFLVSRLVSIPLIVAGDSPLENKIKASPQKLWHPDDDPKSRFHEFNK